MRSQRIDSHIEALERSADLLSTVFFIRKTFILGLCNLGFSLPGDHPYSVTTALTAHTHTLSKIQNTLPTPNNAWVYQTLKYANPTIWTESHFFLFQIPLSKFWSHSLPTNPTIYSLYLRSHYYSSCIYPDEVLPDVMVYNYTPIVYISITAGVETNSDSWCSKLLIERVFVNHLSACGNLAGEGMRV